MDSEKAPKLRIPTSSYIWAAVSKVSSSPECTIDASIFVLSRKYVDNVIPITIHLVPYSRCSTMRPALRPAAAVPTHEHGQYIYAYSHVRTNQVLYSLKRTLDVRLRIIKAPLM